MADVENKNVSAGNSITESKHVSQRLSQTRPKRDAVVEVTDEGEILFVETVRTNFCFRMVNKTFIEKKVSQISLAAVNHVALLSKTGVRVAMRDAPWIIDQLG